MAEGAEITERKGLALAAVMARKDVDAARIGAALGLAAPEGPALVSDGAVALIGTGPGVWLAARDGGAADWADALTERLAGLASVSDQSAGYRLLRLRGPGAQALLQKGVFIDLDPSAFPVGAAAVTVIAHIGVILWKVDESPTFDLAVFRSLAGSLRDWILASADAPLDLPDL
ncbi:MAG: hypothetical protein JO303_02095 [Caulobacteraceae bacterium]|nr:hypothetical protein [Caulobacteraceae bacterium]